MPEPMTRKLILIDAAPRSRDMILTDAIEARLGALAELVAHYDGRMPDAMVEAHLDRVDIIIGQTPMDAARLARARQLKAIVNVKGNWEPTIDYREAQRRGVQVLSIAPMMAPAVAEACIGFAIALGRGVLRNDRVFREGGERYGIRGNGDAASLFGAEIGLVGYGNLGRALRPLLAAFGCRISVYDPWLTQGYLADEGCHAAPLDEILARSRFLFLLAGVHTGNEGFLDRARLMRIADDACVVLASRAEIVDFPAFLELAEARRFRAAIDVFPVEPVPADDPVRRTRNILLSAHLAGGIRDSYRRIAETLDDEIPHLLAGLPARRLQRAEPLLAAMQRSR
jgi:phosphoglycerate dehydrogenase-like enzyme